MSATDAAAQPAADEPTAPAGSTDLPPETPDRLAQAGSAPSRDGNLRLYCLGVPESARQRLLGAGAELLEEATSAADATVVSTRLPPDDLRQVTESLPGRSTRTIVLAHTGAERLAADLIRAGADAVVGEGNEEALLGLVDAERTPTALLASFERRFGAGPAHNVRGLDATTGLPDRRSFERRIGTLNDAEDVPRVGYLKVVSERWSTATPDAVVAIQRRWLATALAHVAGAAGAELFTTGHGEFGLVGLALSTEDSQRLGARLIATAATFRDRGLPLRLVVGHAGPENAHDTEELLELARRAVEVAAVDGVRQVLSAEDLALGVSVTTELEAVVRLLDEVEPAMPTGRGHGERVGRVAAELGRLRGFTPAAVARLQLAAHLHDVGRAGLPPTAIKGPDGLSGELLELWRTFPTRSAEQLRLTAGPAVAEAVGAQREHWDGSGFPGGLQGAEIPEASRIILLAHAIDEYMVAERNLTPGALAKRLEAAAGREFDPELVATAVDHAPTLLAVRH